jgi:hypothetical protein
MGHSSSRPYRLLLKYNLDSDKHWRKYYPLLWYNIDDPLIIVTDDALKSIDSASTRRHPTNRKYLFRGRKDTSKPVLNSKSGFQDRWNKKLSAIWRNIDFRSNLDDAGRKHERLTTVVFMFSLTIVLMCVLLYFTHCFYVVLNFRLIPVFHCFYVFLQPFGCFF